MQPPCPPCSTKASAESLCVLCLVFRVTRAPDTTEATLAWAGDTWEAPPFISTPWVMPLGSVPAIGVVGTPGHGDVWAPAVRTEARPLETFLPTAMIHTRSRHRKTVAFMRFTPKIGRPVSCCVPGGRGSLRSACGQARLGAGRAAPRTSARLPAQCAPRPPAPSAPFPSFRLPPVILLPSGSLPACAGHFGGQRPVT